MMIVADSNVIIASAVKIHDFHARAAPAVASAIRTRDLWMVPHVLIESFSVLTRSPAPMRHPPELAYQTLYLSYGSCRVVESLLRNVWQFLRERDLRTSGGAVYDAAIATTAIEAGADRL